MTDKEHLRKPVVTESEGMRKQGGLFFPDSASVKNADHYLRNVYIYTRARGKIAIQAGGCVGLWPIHLSPKFDRVMTFEPVPNLYRCLKKNIEPFANISAINAAIGDSEAAAIRMSERGLSTGRIDPNFPELSVPMVRLDGFQDFFDSEVSYIQLDIEGFELPALKGACEIIAKWRPILQLEIRGLGNNAALREWLTQNGYIQIQALPRQDFVFMYKGGL